MLLGAVVILIVGSLIINYFRNLDTGQALPPVGTEEAAINLPANHKVKLGEDLWSISETYYGTGYNWIDIAEANDLSNPGLIKEGEELLVPDIEPRTIGTKISDTEVDVEEADATPGPTLEPSIVIPEKIVTEISETADSISDQKITTNTYTVVKGDTLWDISIRAYGDGFRWVDIAAENELVNPNLIHAGNVFVLPK